MSSLIDFQFGSNQVRTHVDASGAPWFLGKDICYIFGDTDHKRSLARIEDADRAVFGAKDSIGRTQQATFINESGLYALLFSMQPAKRVGGGAHTAPQVEARIEKLKRFKTWVTSEVLPSIRKTGQYSVGQTDAVTLPTTFAQALRLAADQAELLEKQGKQLEHAKPAVEFVERYATSSSGSKGFREVCKLLKVKEPEFRDWLIESRIMYRLDGVLTPFAVHHTAGRFEVKAGEANSHAYNHAKFTPKGVAWVANLWSNRRGAQKALSL